MTRVFISYRRDDSAAYAGRLYDRLTAHFGQGQVFMDIDQIEPGEDFVDAIERTVSACESAVVLIGKGWLSAADSEGKRRLDDPDDFVRLEVAAALARKIKVFPVLVGGAAMPKTPQLPEPLQMLARRNAIEISDTRFHADVNRLIEAIAKSLGVAPGTAVRTGPVEPTPETVTITAGATPPRAPAPSPQRETSPPARAPELLGPTGNAARPAGPNLQTTKPGANRRLVVAGVAAAVVATAIGLASMFRTSAPSREADTQATPAGESADPAKVASSAGAGGLVKLRTQDSYASNDKRSVALRTFAQTLRDVPGVRIELEVLPSGSVVRSFEALDAVGQGTLDAAWVSASVFYGKSPAFALLDGTPFGRSPRGYMQWRQDAKVKAIADELYGKFGVKGVLCGVSGQHNVDLWSQKRIDQPSDLKGLKTRAAGVWNDIFTAAGAAVKAFSAGEIYPALSRGLLDAVHISDLPLGAALGLPSITKHVYFPGIMTAAAGVDLIVNARVWDGLGAQAQDAIKLTCQHNVDAMLQAGDAENRTALNSIAGKGATVAVLPQPVTSALHRAWMQVATDKSADPLFARLFDTVRAPAPTQ